MAKNIKITVDNALMGTVELFASEPMVNSGVRQTMPVFLEKHTFKNGTITLSGLQETPADKSWHYRLFVYPEHSYCPVSEGAMQYRFYLPSSVPATVDLTTLIASHSAW